MSNTFVLIQFPDELNFSGDKFKPAWQSGGLVIGKPALLMLSVSRPVELRPGGGAQSMPAGRDR